MKVLHIFDRYLNSTMNWAHNFMVSMQDVDHYVTAPIVFHNSYKEGVQLVLAPYQKSLPMPKDEWSVPGSYRVLDKVLPQFFNQWLKKFVQKNTPDIIHAHFGGVGVRHMHWIEKTNIPFVVSFYGFDMEKLPHKKPAYREFYRELGRIADGIFVLGASSKRTMISRYEMVPDKIYIHPLGIPVDRLPFHTKQKKSGQLRLLQIATLTPKKGQLDAIKALHLALQHYENIHLTLSGEGWDKSYVSEIRAYIEQYNLDKHVRLLPFTPHHQIYDLMSRHDVFIHPSRFTADKDSEGGATFAILEAMAAGLPVLSTNHRSIPERVVHGQMGFISPEGNPKALAQSILRMYEMDDLRYKEMSNSCRKQIEEQFNSDKLIVALRDCYHSICTKKRNTLL